MGILWEPNPGPQTAFLTTEAREVLYGGAVGGGKTDALLVMPLRWADHPQHRAILLRRERKRLQEVIDRSRELYPMVMPGAEWNETEARWRLPGGGFVYMGMAEHERDIEKYRSFQFNLVMFDELTEFTEYQYTYMFSRNRSSSEDLPLQVRSATNPGGEGMAWVFKRFIENREPYRMYAHKVHIEGMADRTIVRQYIPSTVFDNPKLANRDEYIAGLADLDPTTREALLYGRWDKFRGQYFPKPIPVVAPGIKDPDWYVIRCMDYGWGDPTCVLWLVCYPKLREVEVAAELYGSELLTDSIVQMVNETERLTFGNLGPRLRSSVLSPDAFNRSADGGDSIAQMLAAKGLMFTKADNDRKNGWAKVLTMIARGELKCWEGRAPNLMRTLTKLPRDDNDPQDVRKRGVEDHAPEALRYGLMAYVDEGWTAERTVPNPVVERRDPYWEQLQRTLEDRIGEYYEGLGGGW